MENRPGDEFLEELEKIRNDFLQGRPFRDRGGARSKGEIAEARRKRQRGGDNNHRFEGERYLNCPEKSVRRMQLRKLIDEGGQTTVGGKTPSHVELGRWESYEFGLTPEEVSQLERKIRCRKSSLWMVAPTSCGNTLILLNSKRNYVKRLF